MQSRTLLPLFTSSIASLTKAQLPLLFQKPAWPSTLWASQLLSWKALWGRTCFTCKQDKRVGLRRQRYATSHYLSLLYHSFEDFGLNFNLLMSDAKQAHTREIFAFRLLWWCILSPYSQNRWMEIRKKANIGSDPKCRFCRTTHGSSSLALVPSHWAAARPSANPIAHQKDVQSVSDFVSAPSHEAQDRKSRGLIHHSAVQAVNKH